jgi:putative Holliday junction resolvase
VQQKEITNPPGFADSAADLTDISAAPATGRIVALDPGTKRVGVAVCDDLRITCRALPVIERASWKKLLIRVKDILNEFDAAALVIGLPYNFDGTESDMTAEARRMARNFSLSLDIAVFLQDERATTWEARGRLWDQGMDKEQARKFTDSEAATIILGDFLDRLVQK